MIQIWEDGDVKVLIEKEGSVQKKKKKKFVTSRLLNEGRKEGIM